MRLVEENNPSASRLFMRAVLTAFLTFFVVMIFWPWIVLEPVQSLQSRADFHWDSMLSVKDPKQIIRTDDTIYDLEAQRLRILHQGSAEVLLTRPRMMATKQDGTWMTVTAKAGLYDKGTKVLQLIADVHIEDAQGSDLVTQSAVLRLDKQRAEGFSPISGRMGRTINVSAEGFRLDERSSRYKFLGVTKMVIASNSNENQSG